MFPNSPSLLSLDEALSGVCVDGARPVSVCVCACVRMLDSFVCVSAVCVLIRVLFSSLSPQASVCSPGSSGSALW